jgi:hypothetical protein
MVDKVRYGDVPLSPRLQAETGLEREQPVYGLRYATGL